MKESILLNSISKPVHLIRLELQTLRFIAILFVLLFHLWNTKFKNGYLGVDVFFVISGYLMCMLMFCQSKFNYNTVLDFYFKRFKRILPTYLIVMNSVLLFVILFGSQFDYPFIIREILPSALFYSNSPKTHVLSYFDEDSKYSIFLHTWSLSCEVQFYILFLLFFICMLALNNIHYVLKFVFIFSVIIWSFVTQTLTAEFYGKHIIFSGRLWQFFLGFLSHFLYESEFMKEKLKTEFKFLAYKTNYKISNLILYICFVPLILLLCDDFIVSPQLNRLLVSIITCIIISLPIQDDSSSNLLLKNPVFIEIGNISYSVYLIHWPLLVAHRSFSVNSYTLSKEPTFPVGFLLIVLSLSIGFIAEKSIVYVFKHVKTWTLLLLFIAFSYTGLGLNTWYLIRHSPEPQKFDVKMERESFNEIVNIWENRQNYTNLAPGEAFELNKKMTTFIPTRGYVMSLCQNHTKQVPSSYQIDPDLIHSACHETGKGNKTIVVFGNSHAIFGHSGISHLFRDIYSDISTIFQFSCVPLPESQQQKRLSVQQKRNCVVLMEEIVKTLRNWHKPIDILIILFGYNGMDDPVRNPNLSAPDEGFLFMQRFYSQMDGIAKEVMFLPMMNVLFSFLPVRQVQTRLLRGEPANFIGDSRRKIETFMPTARRHLSLIKCDKCIKIEWMDLWCETDLDGLCRVTDENNLLLFIDDHHCSLYGSFFIGEYLRNLYFEYLEKQRLIK